MFENSIELFDYALRELQVAVKNNQQDVEIILKELYHDDSEVSEIRKKLELKVITEMLRENFKDFHIRSTLESHLRGTLTFETVPCIIFYKLVWILRLQHK